MVIVVVAAECFTAKGCTPTPGEPQEAVLNARTIPRRTTVVLDPHVPTG